MKQFILTEGGNLLRFHEILKKPYFESPSGEFLRECSMEEFNHLSSHGILRESWDERLELEPKFLPTWHFLKSIKVLDDFSDYKAETSSNGGNYSFHIYHDWFVAEFPNREWKFAFIERHSTSAEFSYDELAGKFQSDLGEIYLSNVEGDFSYQTQVGKVWDEENECWHGSMPEVVEKIGTISDFKELWNQGFVHVEKCKSFDFEHSLSVKKEIISKMRSLGFPRNNKNFRQGNNRC